MRHPVSTPCRVEQGLSGTVPADQVLPARVRLEPLQAAHIDQVLAVERRIYDFPWTHGNFADALAAGYLARRLLDEDGRLLGYFIAMRGVGEMHLLNLGVAAEHQRRGHARILLDALVAECRAAGCGSLWLEVRAGNRPARLLYAGYGFVEAGVRRGYYPALADPHALAGAAQRREDAVVMFLDLGPPP
jgi:ribosomal-protein-alanine N-acetyltransferase